VVARRQQVRRILSTDFFAHGDPECRGGIFAQGFRLPELGESEIKKRDDSRCEVTAVCHWLLPVPIYLQRFPLAFDPAPFEKTSLIRWPRPEGSASPPGATQQ